MSNPSIFLNGDQIYAEELVRENVRLTIRHEADRQQLEECRAKLAEYERQGTDANEALEACGRAQERARIAEAKLAKADELLARAIEDLHRVMAGGDPCEVCTVKCLMGEGNCKPVWRGEEALE